MSKLLNELCFSCSKKLQYCGQTQAIRYRSTSSAINRGLSATADFTRQSRERPDRRSKTVVSSHDGFSSTASVSRPKRRFPMKGQWQTSPSQIATTGSDRRSNQRTTQSNRRSRGIDEEGDPQIPLSVPHTTAASEFLYGTNVVFAALKAQRRKLYRLYVLARNAGEEHNERQRSRERSSPDLSALAKAAKIPCRYENSLALLDKMSGGRPHNGVVLEASTIPAPPVLGLGKPDHRRSVIPLTLEWQSAEDIAVNGAPEALPTNVDRWRHPFIVMLDGITDPENIGSILRSCHFYGVDAVAIATNTCATLSSPVLAKASSGACEAVRLLALPRPSDFVYESAKAGWAIFAAVAPAPAHLPPSSSEVSRQRTTTQISVASPLAQKPCILMLGSEGQGLRENLRRRADHFVTIERASSPSETPDVGVDSMNVGVAAGVLLEAFMRKPVSAPEQKDTTSDLGW